jgi:UDP-3-O-[3-hydroxymyristoyl] N-acetylglucosamine deacetylase
VQQQSTIAQRVACSGTGLHSGEKVELTLCPAAAGSGIVFVALGAGRDGSDVEIPASARAVSSTSRATTLAVFSTATPPHGLDADGTDAGSYAKIATVEHLLATLYAFEIDNVRIEVKGAEIPAMDGSASYFVDWVRHAGKEKQNLARRELSIVDCFEIRDGDRFIRIEPADSLRISYLIDFAHPVSRRAEAWTTPSSWTKQTYSMRRERAGPTNSFATRSST